MKLEQSPISESVGYAVAKNIRRMEAMQAEDSQYIRLLEETVSLLPGYPDPGVEYRLSTKFLSVLPGQCAALAVMTGPDAAVHIGIVYRNPAMNMPYDAIALSRVTPRQEISVQYMFEAHAFRGVNVTVTEGNGVDTPRTESYHVTESGSIFAVREEGDGMVEIEGHPLNGSACAISEIPKLLVDPSPDAAPFAVDRLLAHPAL